MGSSCFNTIYAFCSDVSVCRFDLVAYYAAKIMNSSRGDLCTVYYYYFGINLSSSSSSSLTLLLLLFLSGRHILLWCINMFRAYRIAAKFTSESFWVQK